MTWNELWCSIFGHAPKNQNEHVVHIHNKHVAHIGTGFSSTFYVTNCRWCRVDLKRRPGSSKWTLKEEG